MAIAVLMLLLAITGTLGAQQAPAKKVRIAFLYSDGNLPSTLKAYKALLKERPDLKDQVAFTFLTESMFDEVKASEITVTTTPTIRPRSMPPHI